MRSNFNPKSIAIIATTATLLIFNFGCSPSAMQAQRGIASFPESAFSSLSVFEKSSSLEEDEFLSLEIRQQESTDHSLTIGVGAVPPPPPPTPVALNSDPLVIQIKPNSKLILSGPEDGVVFDILGDRFTAGRRKVSWPIDTSYAFLALPNEQNRVLDVHQLFGDRTIGPDRKQAAHGFEALKKYDGYLGDGKYSLTQRNSVLDESDPFFSKLRLWSDLDRNGLAESTELATLHQHGIRSIDLKYNPKFAERDSHGNIIAHKSFASKQDGTSALVFDLWLRIEAPK